MGASGSQVDDGRAVRAHFARVRWTMQLAPFRCADGRCQLFIDRALASDCGNSTTHAIPDTRETNNHWDVLSACQHGLGLGSGIRTGQGTQYCTVVAGSSVRYLSRSLGQSLLEALWFDTSTSYLTHSHISRGAQRTRKLTPVIRSMLVSPKFCLLACLVARVAQRTAT